MCIFQFFNINFQTPQDPKEGFVEQDHSDLLNQPSENVCKNALQEKEELAVNIDNDVVTDMNP